jgi:hypothetical protein
VGAAELAQAPQVADAATGKPLCARIGPLVPADADALIDQMSPRLRLESDVSEMHEQVNGYYVLIPALPSRAAGRQKLKELAEAGFDDTWLFRSGSLRNAISLGLFRREASARRHAERVARKGFTTEVKQNLSVRERRWLLIRDTGGDRLGAELTLPAGVARESHPCP